MRVALKHLTRRYPGNYRRLDLSMLAPTRIVAHTGLPTYAARTSASIECSGSGPLQSTLAMDLISVLFDDTTCSPRMPTSHWMHVENCTNSEEDGMHECLSPLDGEEKKIMDNVCASPLV
ncbi:hypothetical protein GGX14DRAFT_402470 [Mycena pura]|uniref:Uncharacterized protein n=1 Tax=Mycena pura TaxID=153505 RepID=A0AAD6Y784_9AGAR|nr:hypothetical protein GGX14DRAFT_402470 [Mycena pura]